MMKRVWLSLLMVLALVAAACGGSDSDDSAATDNGESSADSDGSVDGEAADGESADEESGDDGSGGQGSDDESNGDDGDDGGDDGSADGAAPRGGLAEAIYRLIVEDPTFDTDTFSEEQAACVANRSVDEVGEDRFASYGITAETVASDTLNDIVFEEDDADALAEVFVQCADMMSLMLDGFSSGDAEEACIVEQISEDDLIEFMSLNFQGRDNESFNVFGGVFAACAGSGDGGGDGGANDGVDIGLGDGSLDELLLESLVDSMGLDDTQVACIEEQIADGLSIQADITTIVLNCGLA